MIELGLLSRAQPGVVVRGARRRAERRNTPRLLRDFRGDTRQYPRRRVSTSSVARRLLKLPPQKAARVRSCIRLMLAGHDRSTFI